MAPKMTDNTIANTSSSSKIKKTILKKPLSPQNHRQQQPSHLSYILYLHCEELRRRRASTMRVSQTKLMLTHELITNTIQNIDKCSADDLQSLSRETVFKNNLQRHIARQRHHQYLQMLRMRQGKTATVNQSANSLQQKQQQSMEERSMVVNSNSAETRNC